MAKLYPPNIEGVIPAFYGNILTVPFMMNKTVNSTEIKGFNLIIKTVTNSKLLGSAIYIAADSKNWNRLTNELQFDLTLDDKIFKSLKIGQYYKVQIAYVDIDNVIGFYSNAAVVKYTAEPSIYIDDLDKTATNIFKNNYVGVYKQMNDTSERIYSYQFNIYDSVGNLYDTSGECLHNSFNDTSISESFDSFMVNKDLLMNENYYIQYVVTTTNNLVVYSPRYKIMLKESIDPEINVNIIAELNESNGYILIHLGSADNKKVSGSFILKRASNKDNYTNWESLCIFKFNNNIPTEWSQKDYTVEHGYTYKYALQQFNDENLYSNKIESNEVYCKFEDSFLFDGEKQLKIRFNPKVSSFKNVLMETKTDTIGSQYPFIFRNPSVYYKEFPLSGLISYHSDEAELFITKEEMKLEIENNVNLDDNNVAAERIFKQKVLEFLNDGNPKLFRSPAEGNFIVRLLNVSLSPNDTLGRMLHTFSATAYEIAKYDYQSLLQYNFLKLSNINEYVIRTSTINLSTVGAGVELLPAGAQAISLLIENAPEGASFTVKTNNASQLITIGKSGKYYINKNQGIEFSSIQLNASVTRGTLTYDYKTTIRNLFDTIADLSFKDIPMRQFIGEQSIIPAIENIKYKLSDIYYLRCYLRDVQDLYTNNNQDFYYDKELNHIFNLADINPIFIYRIHNNGVITYGDGNPQKILRNYSTYLNLNNNLINIAKDGYYELYNLGKVQTLINANGLILECAYQVKEITYNIESTDGELIYLKAKLDNATNNYLRMLKWENPAGKIYGKTLPAAAGSSLDFIGKVAQFDIINTPYPKYSFTITFNNGASQTVDVTNAAKYSWSGHGEDYIVSIITNTDIISEEEFKQLTSTEGYAYLLDTKKPGQYQYANYYYLNSEGYTDEYFNDLAMSYYEFNPLNSQTTLEQDYINLLEKKLANY